MTPHILNPRGRPWPISVAVLRLAFSAFSAFSEFDSCPLGTVPAPTTHAIVWANRGGFSARFPRWKHQSATVLPEEVLHTRNPTPASIINTLSSSKMSSRIGGRGAHEHEQTPSDPRCGGGIEVVLRRQALLLGKNKIRRIQLLICRGSFLVMMPYRLVQPFGPAHRHRYARARASTNHYAAPSRRKEGLTSTLSALHHRCQTTCSITDMPNYMLHHRCAKLHAP